MNIIVKKFGGTSVGSIDKIKNIAKQLKREMVSEYRYVIVVSAMGKSTDRLTKMAYELSESPCKRELDMLLTAGERISMSLMSIAFQEEGITSISFTGSQSGIITDSHHGNARIIDVTAFRIREELKQHKVVIVAGFQGVSREKEVTTLGRGGSDTSAVALASYLRAERCDIYTDVDGLYSGDPRIIKDYYKIDQINYDSVLEMAYGGAKVIHPRAVEFAKEYEIPVEIKSSFTFKSGTRITKDVLMEEKKIISLAQKTELTRFLVEGSHLEILEKIKEHNIELFDFSLNENISIIVDKKNYKETKPILQMFNLLEEKEVQSISIIGNMIVNDIDVLMQVIEDIKSFSANIKDVKKNVCGYKIIIESNNIDEVMNKIHNKYVK